MELEELKKVVAAGESETVEFKKSTGLLSRAGETLCGFLNARGGRVFIGITPEGQIVGQQIADITQRDVAVMISRFEPPASVEIGRVHLPSGFDVLILEVKHSPEKAPFIFEGKPYQRVGSTTSVMPQAHYNTLLLARNHDHSRWENAPAKDLDLVDLDHDEILRTVRLGIEAGRLPESTGSNIGEILDRLGLRKRGTIFNAAAVLFGKELLHWYPQCQLRLARFRGVDKSEFLDNRQFRGHAFYLLDEAMAFLHRHLPISGRIVAGRLERIEELLFPTAALREALVNAFCHRDYSITGGAVNVAVFDNRVEIWSAGKLPFGLRPEDLKITHESQPRNLLITDVFFRRGIIEQWGRGTQKIIELCKKAGHPSPEFAEMAGSVVVSFRPASGSITPQVTQPVITPVTAQVTAQDNLISYNDLSEIAEALSMATAQVTTQVAAQVIKLFQAAGGDGNNRANLQATVGISHREHFRKFYIEPLVATGWLELTIPDKPNSRLQKYRLTEKGRAWLSEHQGK